MNNPTLNFIATLLNENQITPEQLQQLITNTPQTIPTVAEYLPTVTNANKPETVKQYTPYWRKLTDQLGHLPLNQIKTSDIATYANHCAKTATQRRNSTGNSAHEHAITAARNFFTHALNDDYITKNPAAAAKKRPRKLTRRALTNEELDNLYNILTTHSNDPELDLLIYRLGHEVGARRSGTINLQIHALNTTNYTITLTEKYDKTRTLPISPELTNALIHHHHTRKNDIKPDTVLRYKNGNPLTKRRFNTFATYWQKHDPDAARNGFTFHWLRHTAITEIERIGGEAIATLQAGHGPLNTTQQYTRSDLTELAQVHQIRTGQPHPMAQ